LPAEYAVWMGEIKALSNFKGIEKFETDLKTLHPILAECQVVKSKLELAVIQYANDISSEAQPIYELLFMCTGSYTPTSVFSIPRDVETRVEFKFLTLMTSLAFIDGFHFEC
ncbi:hypothetical protein Tco_0028419, partial [Tanacetum coccineum]